MDASYVRPELCGQEEDDEGEIDPRIRVELESLNQAASDVNCLEKEINEARTKYQVTFSDSSVDLDTHRSKHGAKIKRARPYYELKGLSKEAQSEALRSARKFQSANSVYLAAKETISLAELRLMDDKAANLSTAWQEMLNHAVLRVMEAEKEKSKNEKDHLEKAAQFAEMEKRLHIMEKKYRKSIEKAKPYFDSKNELELKLQQIKQTIEDLQLAMQSAKSRYSNSLKRLEAISDGIHEIRQKRLMLMYPREPGVGAEEGISEAIDELQTLQPYCNDDKDYDDDDEEKSSLSSEKYLTDQEDEINFDDKSLDDYCENEFRQKVLTYPLDSQQSVFTKQKRKNGTQLVKSKSLPSNLREDHEITDITTAFHCSAKPIDCGCEEHTGNDLNTQSDHLSSGEHDKDVSGLSNVTAEHDQDVSCLSNVTGEYDQDVSCLSNVTGEYDQDVSCLSNVTGEHAQYTSTLG